MDGRGPTTRSLGANNDHHGFPSGNESISHLGKWTIINSKVPRDGGYVSSQLGNVFLVVVKLRKSVELLFQNPITYPAYPMIYKRYYKLDLPPIQDSSQK